MTIYSATTDDITVHVHSLFLERYSSPMNHKFVFGYFIRIENNSTEAVQLLRRHWYIAEERGGIEEVEGEGVIGRQPLIEPNAAHEYNSFCSLESYVGSMEGSYLFQRGTGEEFHVAIPRFYLKAYTN